MHFIFMVTGPLLEITEKSHKINLRSQFLLCMAFRYHKSSSPALQYHQKLLYSIIKGDVTHKSFSHLGVTTNKSCPLLSLDLFSALLQIILIWPRPVTIMTDFVYLSQLFFQASISQIVLEIYYGKVEFSAEFKEAVKKAIEKRDIVDVKEMKESKKISAIFFTEILGDVKDLKALCLPFLRCTALFAFTCMEMPLPEISEDDDDLDIDEFDYLAQFLHFPKLNVMMAELMTKQSMFYVWHQDMKNLKEPEKLLPILAPPEPFQLITMPPLYHDLLQKYNKVRCVHCKTNPNTKAICLVCGMLVCAGNNCCRDARGIGEATKVRFRNMIDFNFE
jgi:hypothetical protein